MITNYLDDFLFLHFLKTVCRELIQAFLDICKQINFPVAVKKTVWPTEIIEFLGVILNGHRFMICVSQDKVNKALQQLCQVMQHKKIRIKKLQQLTGSLNFLTKAIVPGSVFTRRIYNKFSGK